jgi:hypothetical protein
MYRKRDGFLGRNFPAGSRHYTKFPLTESLSQCLLSRPIRARSAKHLIRYAVLVRKKQLECQHVGWNGAPKLSAKKTVTHRRAPTPHQGFS